MKRDTIKKIELLKQIKPSKDWVASTRKQFIEEKEISFVHLFSRSGLALSGALALLLTFGFLNPATAPLYTGLYETPETEEVNGGDLVNLQGFQEVNIVEISDISEDLNKISADFKDIQKQILEAYVVASMVEKGEEKRDLTEKEIAGHLLFEMERAYQAYAGRDKDMFFDASEAFERGDYDEVLDIFLRLR